MVGRRLRMFPVVRPRPQVPSALFLSVLPVPKPPKRMLIFPERVVACDRQKVSCAGHAVTRVKQGGGGDAKLTAHFFQSNVLNE